ncbi:hypothetical protein N7540_012067 [Penicillium herquei]|nr:hypothetical protein N7540_012067 [Penicillium herquei]
MTPSIQASPLMGPQHLNLRDHEGNNVTKMVFEGPFFWEQSVLLNLATSIDSPGTSTWPSPNFRSDNFEKIMLPDLRRVTHHREQYLLLKVVTKTDTVTMASAAFGVEDEDENLSPSNKGEETWDGQELAVDSVLIVKEPRLELEDDGYYALQVDHLSEVLFLAHGSELIPFPWRKEATAAVNRAVLWKEAAISRKMETTFLPLRGKVEYPTYSSLGRPSLIILTVNRVEVVPRTIVIPKDHIESRLLL